MDHQESEQIQEQEDLVDLSLTQTTYQPTEYQDASWPVIGEVHLSEDFLPTQFDVVAGSEGIVDPMFEDFGGLPPIESKVRWHLPKELAYQKHDEEEKSKEPEIVTTTLTEAELEGVKKEAYDEGYAVASAEMNAKLQEQDEIYKQKMQEVFSDIQKQIEENLKTIERQTLDLALAISKKIIDDAVEINPEYIVDIINKAVALGGTAEVKTIRVSPQDFEFINLVGVGNSVKGFQENWQFVADPTIKAGCIVETSAGEIDYQLDLAWERVQDKVLKIAK
ncbi:MAG: FliH/SctL family protein [Bdellovibrionota bacterium]